MNLYLVTCRGMNDSTTGTIQGTAFVLAEDAESAYRRVRDYLDENAIGFHDDREMKSVELLASDAQYPACRMRVFT